MAEVLKELSDALAAAVESAGPSIVRVEARHRLPATGIVWSADGVVVTSNHVVERDENINVGLPNGETVSATLVGRDPSTDLAVLRAKGSGLTVPTWAEPETYKVGHLVLALGRPGPKVLATMGIVSALDGDWQTHGGGQIDHYVQTDVVMYPGFSGGPLVDPQRRILGMNTSALMRGVSLTVPAPTLRRVVETLLSHGKMRRGYLGIGAQPVRLPEPLGKELGQEVALLLMTVEPNSPAEKGGLLLGDVLTGVNGRPVQRVDELLSLLGGDVVGKSLPMRVVRGGQVITVNVTIGERS